VDGAGGAILQAVAPATVSHLSLYPKEIARRRRQLNFKIISLTTRGRQPPQRNRPRLRGKRRERELCLQGLSREEDAVDLQHFL
jgi:hypothetical protein